MSRLARTRERLDAAGQGRLLRFYDELPEARRSALLDRIDAIDLAAIPGLVERFVRARPALEDFGGLAPAPCVTLDAARREREQWRAAGEALVRAGKVAAFTVAGGQGTRLGFDGPKGLFPAGPVTRKPLFERLAEWVLAARDRFGATIPWCIMTSPANHAPTAAFLRERGWFGLGEENVIVFTQGVMPTLDIATGRVLLAAKDEPAVHPDGHGGSLRALWTSGAVKELRRRGVEHLSYVQVDNPIARVIDPVFLGMHAGHPASSGEMSSKMLRKTEPGERVGVFCSAGGKVRLAEYSDLPAGLAAARDARGELVFSAGNPAIHILGLEFVERLNRAPGGFALPLHRAEKRTPCIDPRTGAAIDPATPNSVKLETFVFDALPLCGRALIVETERVEEFAPIKNATGADSPESSGRIQTQRAARWLEAAGVRVTRDGAGEARCTLEISPLTAMEAGDLLRAGVRERLPREVGVGESLAM